MSFTKPSQFSIRGRNTFNHVQGNQVNQAISGGVIHVHGPAVQALEHTISDEFEYVKLGHIIGVEDLGSVDLSEWDWDWKNGVLARQRRKSARKTVSSVNIHPDRQSKFTVFTYEGDDANQTWNRDFQQFSHAGRRGSFQLFGINHSEVPMLIFHHELIPVAHFFTGSFWMNVCIQCLAINKGCGWDSLWLNTGSGSLCEGPAGPDFHLKYLVVDEVVVRDLPSTLDVLEESSFIRFLSRFGASMDLYVLKCTTWHYERIYFDDLVSNISEGQHSIHPDSIPYLHGLWQNLPRHLPIDIIGKLRFDTIYSPLLEPVARQPPEVPGLWELVDVHGLAEETWFNSGLTRFKLIRHREVFLQAGFDLQTFGNGWLSQSSCVFNALETTEGRETFFMVYMPRLSLRSTRREYSTPDRLSILDNAAEETSPVYLFLYPLPMTITELISWISGHTHFWSFDETGQSRIPEEKWEQWGLPVLTLNVDDTRLFSWPDDIYAALRDWQIARGFDPSTSDWARHMKYPGFEVIGAEKKGRIQKRETVEPLPGVRPERRQ